MSQDQKIYLLVLIVVLASLGALSATPPETIMQEAQTAFAQANEAALSEPARAGQLYAEAARKFDYLTRQAGIENGDLYLNLGNASFLAGDMGQALLAYRRAEHFLPQDLELRAGLQHLRQQRIDSFPEDSNASWWRGICFWHYHLGHNARSMIFACAYLGLFAGVAWWLVRKQDAARYVIAGCAIATILLGLSLLLHLPGNAGQDAVITASETTARKGDSYVYEPAFTNPLHAGTEITVREERGDWALVELPGNQRAWIERADLELINPTSGTR